MSKIAYYRVSTRGPTIEVQRNALSGPSDETFDMEFVDQGERCQRPSQPMPGFEDMMRYVRDGDALHVFALSGLGRRAIEIEHTVHRLLERGVALQVCGLGKVGLGAGDLILAVLAQFVEAERIAVADRCAAGRAAAHNSLAESGLMSRGKASLGRPKACDPGKVSAWREANGATLAKTAEHFGISVATVKRYLALGTRSPGGADGHGDVPVDRNLALEPGVVDLGKAQRRGKPAASHDACGATGDLVLPTPPAAVTVREDGFEVGVATPVGHNVAEPSVGEIDVPLPFDLGEGTSTSAPQCGPEIMEHSVPLGGGEVKPGRTEPTKRRRADGGLVRKGIGGSSPIGSAGGVDDQMTLPFDNPQGGVGEESGG